MLLLPLVKDHVELIDIENARLINKKAQLIYLKQTREDERDLLNEQIDIDYIPTPEVQKIRDELRLLYKEHQLFLDNNKLLPENELLVKEIEYLEKENKLIQSHNVTLSKSFVFWNLAESGIF